MMYQGTLIAPVALFAIGLFVTYAWRVWALNDSLNH